jgi:hypothetical protein
VLTVAVLLLVVPLGALYLLGKVNGGGAPFNPEVGACVKKSGEQPVPANCGDEGAFTVVSKVPTRDKCADPAQPYVAVRTANNTEQVLCLRPAAGG